MTPRLVPLAALLLVASHAPAAGPPRAVSFRHDVFPLLSRQCLRCHQGTNPSSAVRLDARSELLGESNGRPLVLVGKADQSTLVRAVRGEVHDKLMPPAGRGKRLTPEQIDLFRSWINQGLAWDDALLPPIAAPTHWAFQPITRPAVPRSAPPGHTPIDAFLATAHNARGLRPVAEAPRRVLIQRLYLDLIGLPPSPEAIDAFVADSRPDAYERLVDRLLASASHGERSARHWLDLARYADSEGYESNHLRPHAWRYRDWVIAAFNSDLPFADFIKLQLAGDEVRPYSDDNLIATGFLAAARLSSNEEDRARQRNDILVDVVNTTTGAFLGLTMHCSQCHNHKFDPFTARDYYRFQSFFVRGQPGNLALRDPALVAGFQALLPPNYEKDQKRRDDILDMGRTRLVAKAKADLPEAERRALDVPPEQRSDEEETLARQAEVKLQFSTGRLEQHIPAELRKEYEKLKKRLAEQEKKLPDQPQTFGYLAPATAAAPVSVLPMKGFYPLLHEPAKLARLQSRILVGGDVNRRGPVVEPGWPAVFGPTPATLSPTPRLALAGWLASEKNPLVARVWVNRLWQWHFGRGLVGTSSDFGVKGARPSHPELLDWLASEFLASGGSTKHIRRLIVLSSAYRRASTFQAGNAAIDADNVYLWRWQPRRLEAEAIRDRLLAVTGELDPCLGGPGVSDELKSRRRGLYLFQRRDYPPMLQGLFNGPVASAEPCPRRGVSTVPLHALYLLNNPFVTQRAEALASLVRSTEDGYDEQIRRAFRLVLGRTPHANEVEASKRFFDRFGADALPTFCHALLNTSEFLYLE
jgi:hypothetical protein